jgi:septal ring factor EnvC (AmiA/AmiB activator)
MRFIPGLIIFLLLFSSTLVFSQSKKKLQQEKQKIEKDIHFAASLLKKVRKNKKATYNEFILVKKQIQSRENLIENVNKQIRAIDHQIQINDELLANLQSDIKSLKDEYAKIIYNAYKTRSSYQKIVFVFASEDVNQAFKRIKYLEQYSEYRKKQAAQIEKTQEEIEKTQSLLKQQREEKLALLSSQNMEKEKLLEEKKKRNEMIQELSKEEKKLRQQIQENEKIRQRLAKKIQKIIAEEIAKASKKSGKKGAKNFALTPEEQLLSDDFASNKGKLPWPVERGIISENFGKHAHPFLKHVQVNNRGINILTKENLKARAVFDGTVTLVMKMQGYHTVVMIRHGNFITVYSNLVNVKVKKGDKVKTKQELGTIFTSPKDHKTELHFELWKNKKLFNPKPWLAKNK